MRNKLKRLNKMNRNYYYNKKKLNSRNQFYYRRYKIFINIK